MNTLQLLTNAIKTNNSNLFQIVYEMNGNEVKNQDPLLLWYSSNMCLPIAKYLSEDKQVTMETISFQKQLNFSKQLLTHKQAVTWAILCAESVLGIWEKKHPKQLEPQAVIAAAKAWLLDPSEENKRQCRDAASAAYAAADAAAYAASAANAAYAAANAAYATNAAYAADAAAHAAAYAACAAAYAAENKKKKEREIIELLFQVLREDI